MKSIGKIVTVFVMMSASVLAWGAGRLSETESAHFIYSQMLAGVAKLIEPVDPDGVAIITESEFSLSSHRCEPLFVFSDPNGNKTTIAVVVKQLNEVYTDENSSVEDERSVIELRGAVRFQEWNVKDFGVYSQPRRDYFVAGTRIRFDNPGRAAEVRGAFLRLMKVCPPLAPGGFDY